MKRSVPPARVLAALALSVPALLGAAPAGGWADASTATIHPGVQTTTEGAQCTANFVFTAGTDVLLGQAAHCSGTGAATDTDGCAAGSLPLGTPVEIQGADHPGELVYSSWIAMANAGETDADTCAYNDFALVRIDPRDHDAVNPSVPVFGGPQGIDTAGPRRRAGLHLRQLLAAARPDPAVAPRRPQPRDGRQWVEHHDLHGHPGRAR